MLVIRNCQLDEMRRELVDAYLRELISSFPGCGLSLPLVSAAATRFGIASYPDLREFVRLLADIGAQALQDPAQQWIAEVLEDTELPSPSARLARLSDLRARQALLAVRNAEAEQLFAAAAARVNGGMA